MRPMPQALNQIENEKIRNHMYDVCKWIKKYAEIQHLEINDSLYDTINEEYIDHLGLPFKYSIFLAMNFEELMNHNYN